MVFCMDLPVILTVVVAYKWLEILRAEGSAESGGKWSEGEIIKGNIHTHKPDKITTR